MTKHDEVTLERVRVAGTVELIYRVTGSAEGWIIRRMMYGPAGKLTLETWYPTKKDPSTIALLPDLSLALKGGRIRFDRKRDAVAALRGDPGAEDLTPEDEPERVDQVPAAVPGGGGRR